MAPAEGIAFPEHRENTELIKLTENSHLQGFGFREVVNDVSDVKDWNLRKINVAVFLIVLMKVFLGLP